MKAGNSKYAKYDSEIRELSSRGLSVEKILDRIGEDELTKDGMYYYMRANRIRVNPYKGGSHAEFKKCEECNNSLVVETESGRQSRVCTRYLRIVPKAVRTSPIWCDVR